MSPIAMAHCINAGSWKRQFAIQLRAMRPDIAAKHRAVQEAYDELTRLERLVAEQRERVTQAHMALFPGREG